MQYEAVKEAHITDFSDHCTKWYLSRCHEPVRAEIEPQTHEEEEKVAGSPGSTFINIRIFNCWVFVVLHGLEIQVLWVVPLV